MELAYVCEWEKRPKSTHCPSIPLVCSWSCRNLVAFTTDLKNDNEDKGNWQLCVSFSFLLFWAAVTAGPVGVPHTHGATLSFQLLSMCGCSSVESWLAPKEILCF